jgi:pyruvate/2-oxoglutarate dehydrogenase complex dihydrolipoamide acyltransferase (E2) component
MTQILMPALSPTMEEGKLAKWHVKEGDVVKAGDILAEIETDKATMEFESIDAGRIAKLLVPEGAEAVKVNAPIAELAIDGEVTAALPARAAAAKRKNLLLLRGWPAEGAVVNCPARTGARQRSAAPSRSRTAPSSSP